MPARKKFTSKKTTKSKTTKKKVIEKKEAVVEAPIITPEITPEAKPIFETSPAEIVVPSVEPVLEITPEINNGPLGSVSGAAAETEVKPIETNSITETVNLLNNDKKETSIEIESPKKTNPIIKIFILFFVFLIGLAIGVLGMYLYQTKRAPIKIIFKNQPTPTVSIVEPTLVPTKVPINLQKYSIIVLNGSTIKGEAGVLKTSLENEGFNVLSAGNATSSAFKNTVIQLKTSVDTNFLEELETFLSKTFVIEKQTLKDSNKSDIVITIGGSRI